ncbi:3-methyladenine DNA glycosylase [Neodidymelliopsis sp. IMI 364377]|nr:3-methyladenine DNA glycosylase [Neodidymelliopsis sp. IMI 364377]
MSLRRSARNAEKVKIAVPEVAESLYEKSSSNGAAKKTTTVPKKTAVPRKAVAAKKRKVLEAVSSVSNGDAQSSDIKSEGDTPASDMDITKPVEIFAAPAEPSTPLPAKRRRKADTVSPAKSIPFTPTPSGVGLMLGSTKAAKKDTDHMLDDLASLNRPASPHFTNAPVLTPNGSQVVVANGDSPAKKRKAKDLPPDVGSPLKAASSTIDTMLKDAEEFLINVDPRLRKVVQGHQCKIFTPEGLREVVDPFTALSSGIIGQQVSGQAAASIRKKFTALFPTTHPSFPSPAQVLALDIPTLRTAGLSQRKAEYITGLAEKFASGEFTAEGLVNASDEELIEKLVAVRGLGRWSVEMFACFGLKRMDVFSTGDLGVQ